MKRRILLVAISFFLLSSLAVYAVSDNQNNGSSNAPKAIGSENSESAKCKNVTKKVDMLTERYNQNQNRYINAFQNIHQSMEKFILKFKADGYDTAQLEEHNAEFNNMIQNAAQSYYQFRVSLENSKEETCGENDAQAREQFTAAKTELRNFKNEMVELRTFVKETLRQDILTLRAQITQSEEEEPEENESEEDESQDAE